MVSSPGRASFGVFQNPDRKKEFGCSGQSFRLAIASRTSRGASGTDLWRNWKLGKKNRVNRRAIIKSVVIYAVGPGSYRPISVVPHRTYKLCVLVASGSRDGILALFLGCGAAPLPPRTVDVAGHPPPLRGSAGFRSFGHRWLNGCWFPQLAGDILVFAGRDHGDAF